MALLADQAAGHGVLAPLAGPAHFALSGHGEMERGGLDDGETDNNNIRMHLLGSLVMDICIHLHFWPSYFSTTWQVKTESKISLVSCGEICVDLCCRSLLLRFPCLAII